MTKTAKLFLHHVNNEVSSFEHGVPWRGHCTHIVLIPIFMSNLKNSVTKQALLETFFLNPHFFVAIDQSVGL